MQGGRVLCLDAAQVFSTHKSVRRRFVCVTREFGKCVSVINIVIVNSARWRWRRDITKPIKGNSNHWGIFVAAISSSNWILIYCKSSYSARASCYYGGGIITLYHISLNITSDSFAIMKLIAFQISTVVTPKLNYTLLLQNYYSLPKLNHYKIIELIKFWIKRFLLTKKNTDTLSLRH